MTDRLERIVAVVLLALAAIVFFAQARSVFVAPQPNSVRWFGDETWLMTEAKQQISTGVVGYPLALGTSLTEHKGLVLGVSWLSSALYGIPAVVSSADVVVVGRTVTLFFAALIGIGMNMCARLLGARMSLAALAVVLLVANRSFLFTSHSARPDLLAGLMVMVVVSIGTWWIERSRKFTPSQAFMLGALTAFVMVSSSIHLLTLVGPVALFFAVRLGLLRSPRLALSSAAGVATTFGILAAVYYATTGSIALFGAHTTHAQFEDVVSSIPILRPFSRSVQVANLIIRTKQFWAEAPQALIALPLILVALVSKRREFSAIGLALAIVLLSWLLLQGAEVHYLMHVVPVMLLVSAVLLSRTVRSRFEVELFGSLLVAGFFSVLAIRDSNAALIEGTRIARSNDRAVAGLLMAIANDWQYHDVPTVVTEPPSLEGLLKYPVRVSTDHFISFPRYDLPIDRYLDTIGADYVVLYNSPSYPKDRPASDPFYQAVRSHGKLIDIEIGTIGDFGRDYFHRSDFRDTLLLVRWPRP